MKRGNLNLYIDESGSGAIYEKSKDYRFFLMTGIILDENKEPKASKFIHSWKSKYLVDSHFPLHAADIYEDHIDKKSSKKKVYRKKILDDINILKKAIESLVDFIVQLRLSIRICYVDLHKVRKDLNLNPYIIGKKKDSFKTLMSVEYSKEILFPVITIANRLYRLHESLITKSNYYKSGFIYYESQSEYDLKILSSFHKYVNKSYIKNHAYSFGDLILGINFLNKSSLCAGLDIADYISYCYMQLLRKRFRKDELVIAKEKLTVMENHFYHLQYNSDIKSIEVTKDCVEGLKAIKSANKKAS